MARIVSIGWAAAGVVTACGDDSAPLQPDSSALELGPSDAGTEPDTAVDSPAAPPARPVLGPCAAGWRAIPAADELDVPTCEPWPEGGRAACSRDEAHLPGDPGCLPIGSPCSADDDWAVDLPEGRPIRYVRPGASSGDGSRESPHGSLTRALASARAGEVVALARGTYDGIVTIPDGVTVWGACVAETLLRYAFDEPAKQSAIVSTPGHATLRNVRVRGSNHPTPAIGVGAPDTSLDVEHVVVEAAAGAGLIAVNTAEIRAHDVVVQNIAFTATLPRVGAIFTALGGRVIARRAALRDCEIGAAHADGPGSYIELQDSVIHDFTAPNALHAAGGASAIYGSRVVLRRVVLEHVGSVALRSSADADGVRPSLEAEDVVVRDSQSRAPNSGFGFFGRGGDVSLRRVLIERARAQAGVVQTGGHLAAEDLVIRDTASNASGPYTGRGLEIQDNATAVLARVFLTRNHEVSIHLVDAATLEATDLSIADTRPNLDLASAFGLGLQAEGVSNVSLQRASISGSYEHGIALLTGTNATLRDVTIQGTAESACTEPARCVLVGGVGIAVVGAHLFAERFALVESGLAGLHLAEQSTAELRLGWIARNPIGLNVAADGLDIDALVAEIRFSDNGDDVQSQTIPLPSELESLSGE